MSGGQIRFGVAAGIVSLVVDGLAGIALVHLLFKHLHPTAAGFWSLVTTVGSLLLIVPNSLSPAISRKVAQLQSDQATSGTETALLCRSIRDSIRYAQITLLTISFVVYLGYLMPVCRSNDLHITGSMAWMLYVLGLTFNCEASGHIAFLNGLGEVGWDKVIRIITSSFGLIANWCILRFGGEIICLGLIFLLQSLILFSVSQKISKERGFGPISRYSKLTFPKSLMVEGAKLLLLGCGGYIVANAGTITIERVFGLADVGRYNALLRVSTILSSVGVLFSQMAYPSVAQAWARGDRERVKALYLKGIGFAIGLWALGACAIWLTSEWIFPRWLGAGNYLGPEVLFWLLCYQLVYVNHIAQSTPVLAASGNAFIGSALLIVFLAPCLVAWFAMRFGIVGVPIGTIAGMLPSSIWVIYRSSRFIFQYRSPA